MRWIKNCLNGQAQKVVINGAKSSWRPITCAVPQGSILGPVLFNIFSNDLDDETECTFGRFVDDRKLGGEADMSEGCSAIPRDLGRLKKWADKDLVKFNNRK